MKHERQTHPQRPRSRWPWLALLCVLLLAGATPATAANYFFTGQVFQVNPDDAADDAIADGDLEGDPRPYATVKLYDAETGILLGDAFTDADGIFTVQYDLPTGSTPDVRVRVFQELVNDTDVELPASREGLNEHESVGPFAGSGVWVTPDDYLSYAASGSISDPGVGVVFTRVGKVEIPFIEQDPTDDLAGLADFTSNPARAAELHVSAFDDAPFSGGLLVFGAFGLPGGACLGQEIDYYRAFISKWNGATWGAPQVWDQPMSKYRTTVTVSPTVTVHHDLVPVGPFSGTISGGGGSIGDLYWVNEDVPGFPTSTFYSFPDLRVNWNTRNWAKAPDTGLAGGVYRITMEYYRYVSGSTNAPVVSLLPAGCFTGTPASGAEGLHQLVLGVNNQPLDVHFDHIYLVNPSGDFFPATGTTPVSNVGDALDFNGAGLCEILDLAPSYGVQVRFTAHHPGGFMRYYHLRATPNSGSQVEFANESYPPLPSPPFVPPLWSGTPAAGSTETVPHSGWARCNYIFSLSAGSRLQDGYNYVQWAHPQRAFYVDP